MPNLQQFVYNACGGINFRTKTKNDKDQIINHFLGFCEKYSRIGNYYFIVHDETDIIHIHYCLCMSAQTRLMTIFNKISDTIWDDINHDNNSIEIEKCKSVNSQLRYMLHIDKGSKRDGKKEYTIEDIITNDTYNSIEGIINSEKGNIDPYYLRNAVLDYPDEFDLMAYLGLAVYHKYRYEIQSLKEMRASLRQRRDEEKGQYEDLPF